MSKILFIEDNKIKAEEIIDYCNSEIKNIEITWRESFTSGLREYFINDYDILFLDMSLPTRDGLQSNSLNDFEQLGGYKVLSEMKRKNKVTPTILITMFSEFGVGSSFMDLEQLNSICEDEFSEFYKGLIFYSSKKVEWKEKLRNKILSLL
jgi:DNA-binding LytR/AlgR family response regulator